MIYEAFNQAVYAAVPGESRRILDLGCGTGSLGLALKHRGKIEVTGVTYSAEEAAQATSRLDRVLIEDLNDFEPSAALGTFDVIICSHVLEHLLDPRRLLAALRARLGPGGLLVVALPNVLHWKQRLRFLSGHFKYTQGGIMDSTHLAFYDWDTARALVAESGYRLISARGEGNLPQPLIRRLLPRSLTTRLDELAAAKFPGLFGAQFILVASPETRDATPSPSTK